MSDFSISQQTTPALTALASGKAGTDNITLLQKQAELLLAVSTALGGAITTSQVADVIIQAAFPIFQARIGLVALLADDGSRLDCERIVGVSPAEADLWHSIPADARLPLADAVREHRLVLLTSEEERDAAYPDAASSRAAVGEGALVAIPLLVGERCIGGLGLICPPERCQDKHQQTFLWTLAGQCALVLERARLYDAEKRAREEAVAEVAERQYAEAALRESERRLRFALEGGGLETWHWNLATGDVNWPANTKALFGLSPEALTEWERILKLLHPEDRERADDAMHRAIAGGPDYNEEYRVFWPDGSMHWIASRGRVQRDGQGTAVSIEGVAADITGRVERSRRERFLADLAERARGLTDPEEVIADALHSIGKFLQVSRALFADIDITADTCTVQPDYRADGTVSSIEGTFPISAFGPFVVAEYAAGRVAVVEDVHSDPIKAPPDTVSAYESIGVRAYVAAPVMHSARLVSAIAVHSMVPRQWNPEEVEFIKTVGNRTWLTVEVLRQQRALVRESEERREAHARTATILESITDAFIAFDREWRFTFVNDQADKIMSLKRDHVMGNVFWEVFPHLNGTVFDHQYHRAMAEKVSVSFETFYPTLNTWLEVRAFPSPDGLSVYFRDINERKAMETERAQIAEREHRIAEELQAALQPELPGSVPGLAVTKYYKAMLTDQAGVGGDFYDVFFVKKGCTALVVGDLSGKGLAAAAQVSTVRNMLRAFLYTRPIVAEAVAELNRSLAEHCLLTGFSTLFVSVYDSGTRKLKFVNCGQELALIRRGTTGLVEQLAPTGPILGSIEDAHYVEETVMLAPGDALAIFTDGLTECGSGHMNMLGIGGVAAMFGEVVTGSSIHNAAEMAEHLALRLIQDVGAAGGAMRDDVCLLIAVVQ